MSTFLILLLAVGVLAFVWYRMRRSARGASQGPGDFEDLNEKFLRNPGGKSDPVDFVRVFHPDDLSLLRSLLDSEGIESYVVESRMGAIYPLETIPGFVDSTVAVYRSDLEAARQVVTDFVSVGPGGGRSSRPELLEPRSP